MLLLILSCGGRYSCICFLAKKNKNKMSTHRLTFTIILGVKARHAQRLGLSKVTRCVGEWGLCNCLNCYTANTIAFSPLKKRINERSNGRIVQSLPFLLFYSLGAIVTRIFQSSCFPYHYIWELRNAVWIV